MQVRDIMSSNVVSVRAGTSVRDAARLLAARGFTALPVLDDDDRVIGLLTESDILRDRFPHDPRYYCSDEGEISRPDDPPRSPAPTVGGVMTAPVTCAEPGGDVADVVTTMRDGGLRSIPVVHEGRLVGIVTRRDLVRTLTRDDAAVARDVRHQLETYGGPGRWTVEVDGGAVTIGDALDNRTDRHVATVLAEAVRGVTVARMASEGAPR